MMKNPWVYPYPYRTLKWQAKARSTSSGGSLAFMPLPLLLQMPMPQNPGCQPTLRIGLLQTLSILLYLLTECFHKWLTPYALANLTTSLNISLRHFRLLPTLSRKFYSALYSEQDSAGLLHLMKFCVILASQSPICMPMSESLLSHFIASGGQHQWARVQW